MAVRNSKVRASQPADEAGGDELPAELKIQAEAARTQRLGVLNGVLRTYRRLLRKLDIDPEGFRESMGVFPTLTRDDILSNIQWTQSLIAGAQTQHLEWEALEWYDNTHGRIEQEAAEQTAEAQNVDAEVATKFKRLKKELTALKVRPETIQAIERDIRNAGRPKWNTRPEKQKPELQHLTAPLFLKTVWADEIHRGKIFRDLVSDYDDDLVKAVRVYVSQRKKRNLDAGDAKGISIIKRKKRRESQKGLDM